MASCGRRRGRRRLGEREPRGENVFSIDGEDRVEARCRESFFARGRGIRKFDCEEEGCLFFHNKTFLCKNSKILNIVRVEF